MKKYLFLIIAVFSLSCKKDSSSAKLIGEWELRSSINGMTGAQTEYPMDNGMALKFSERAYERYLSGKLINSGSYRTIMDSSIITNGLAERIIYDEELDTPKSFVKVEANRMTIWIDGYDAPSLGYEKKNRHH